MFITDAVLDGAQCSAVIKDSHGTYMYMNRVCEQWFDVKPGEMIGKTDFHLQPDQEAAVLRHNDRQVLMTGKDLSAIEVAKLPGGRQGLFITQKFCIELDNRKFLALLGVQITDEAAKLGVERAAQHGERILTDSSPYRQRLVELVEKLAHVNR